MSEPTVVDLIVLVFLTLDVLMKLREWIQLFLKRSEPETDTEAVSLTRKDRENLRQFLATTPGVHQAIEANLTDRVNRIARKAHLILGAVAPETLRMYDDDLASTV